MQRYLFCFIVVSVFALDTVAQFAPQAGVSGTTAIHKSSALIKAWATSCTVKRGYLDIASPSSGVTTTGEDVFATGAADGQIVSMGDSGVAVLQFAQAVQNGDGPDFAVFENGFQNPANLEEAFLELAFVEVSSDGEHFFRFPATSNTPATPQIKGAGEYMDARLVNNLAGKYVAQYGTPFDLEELKAVPGLDVDNITHIRIVDAVGSVDANGTLDHLGQKINDPYPTPYPTGGFDLDAVGVIHRKGTGMDEVAGVSLAQVFPNPASNTLYIILPYLQDKADIVLADLSGKIILRQEAALQNELPIGNLCSGLYLLGLAYSSGIQWIGKCSKI